MRSKGIRRGLALAGLAALAISINASVASAHPGPPPPGELAAKHCIKQAQALGPRAFHQRYGPHAMRNCVRAAQVRVRVASQAAKQECRAELAELGPGAFSARYGTPGHLRPAFRRCVLTKVREHLAELRAALLAAARECKAELDEAGPRAFIERYGPGRALRPRHALRRAFHNCIASKLSDDEGAGEEVPEGT